MLISKIVETFEPVICCMEFRQDLPALILQSLLLIFFGQPEKVFALGWAVSGIQQVLDDSFLCSIHFGTFLSHSGISILPVLNHVKCRFSIIYHTLTA